MIVFDLKCDRDHVFEAWFKDGETYQVQRDRHEIACPSCGGTGISKAPMAPRVKRSRTGASDPQAKAAGARRLLEDLRRKVEENCDYVGPAFAEEARKIHYGEVDARGIYGEASDDESQALTDEGVPHQRIPWIERTDS